jgi:hypothetical protein
MVYLCGNHFFFFFSFTSYGFSHIPAMELVFITLNFEEDASFGHFDEQKKFLLI